MKLNKTIIVPILIFIIALGLGFFTGSKFQSQKQFRNFQGMGIGSKNLNNLQRGDKIPNQANQNAFRGGNVGEIISIDEKSMTVKMQDGSSKIILLTESVIVNKATKAAKSDLKVGEKVSVFGATNTDGSLTASSIELNPPMRNLP